MDAHEAVTTVAPSGGGGALTPNIIGDSNVNIVNRGDGNRAHIGHDNRNNQGVIVFGGSANFTTHGESSDILNELRRAPAYYDSSLRKQAQECMQETRVAILNTIFEWVDSIDSPPIFWLYGLAGTGKSTIAHTVAKECRRRGRLGASFFFAHANAECSDPDLFFSTIAYQLSKFDSDLRQHIVHGVRSHPSPQDASIPTQFEEFILTPLRKLSNGSAREPIIVVVDAFDECSDTRKASEILQLLSAKIPGLSPRLKVFITSRPEPEIRSIFHPDIHLISRSFDLLRDIDASSTNEDIKRFLRFHLGRIGKEYDLPSWPREMDIETLAQQASGLFIFAYTGIEFIRDRDVMDPESQLAVLKTIGTDGTPAFNLNALYSRILQKAIPETISTRIQERVITVIHTIVGLKSPLALSAIEKFLGLDRGAMRVALNRLRSVFIVPDNDKEIVQVIHPSFARYITDEESCTEKRFFVCLRQLHSQLAKHCLRQMKTHLKQNICSFKDFMAVEAPVKDEEISDVTLTEELKYSCEKFAAHVFSADWQDADLCEMVAECVNQYLLYWLEVLALVGSFREALPSLRLLSDFCESASHLELSGTGHGEHRGYDYVEIPRADNSDSRVQAQTSTAAPSKSRQFFQRLLPKRLKVNAAASELSSDMEKQEFPHQLLLATKSFKALTVAPNQSPRLIESLKLLADAIRIVSESYDDIKRSPYQIYASCLTFCPLDSPLFKQYSRLSTVRVLSGERKNWRPLLHAFKDPDGSVISLTFSPDGTTLASDSYFGKIFLWNLETGESRLLAYHTRRRILFSLGVDYVNLHQAFTFSPDGRYITADGHVYKVATGEELLIPGICAAFSPDGRHVALGYTDGTIKLYDMQAPNLSLLHDFLGHRRTVTTLAFSSDNKFLTSASSDGTIRVWNCSSGEMITQIPLRGRGYVTFSPNGAYVSTCYESVSLHKECKTYIWVADIQTGKEKSIEVLGKFGLPGGSRMVFSPCSNYIGSCNNVAIFVVGWAAATEVPGTLLNSDLSNTITSISFAPDEQSLLVGNEQGLIRSWRVPKDGRFLDTFDFECKAHFGAVEAITFSHDGKYFASASVDGSICVWDSTSVDLHESDLTSVLHGQTALFAPDGQTIAVGSGNTISKMDATTGHSIFYRESALDKGSHRLSISADGKYFASNSLPELLFWDTGNECALGQRRIPPKSGDRIIAQAFSPDATRYVVRFLNGDLWVYDLRNGESRQMVHPNRTPYFEELRFSHDGRHLVSCTQNICVFDVEKGVQMELDLPVRSHVFSCAFSPCSQHIAVAHDNGLDALEYQTNKPNVREVHRTYGYCSVQFSPNATYILAATDATAAQGRQLELHLFDSDTLEVLYKVDIQVWSGQHIPNVMREFRRTGRFLNHPLFQPSEYEGLPYLLDNDGWVITASSKRLCRLPVANRGEVYDVNGNRIVVVSPEGKVTLIQFGPNPICIPTPAVE